MTIEPTRQVLGNEGSASLLLHFMRAAAAQTVCVGHAINLSGIGYTFLPHVGVMVFFVLSGFVIANTLAVKSSTPTYSLRQFVIERFARIYTAYLPGMILIACMDYIAKNLGTDPGNTSPLIWFGNLLMQQQHPLTRFPNFGSTGHLTSLALEFHIYLFVGATWFLLLSRRPLTSALVAVCFSLYPFYYFRASLEGGDKALFVLWLMGFASFFIVRSAQLTKKASSICAAFGVSLFIVWLIEREPGLEYELKNYPVLTLSFLSLVLFGVKTVPHRIVARVKPIIIYFAEYSFSLFLLHYTILKLFFAWSQLDPAATLFTAVISANAVSALFASMFEKHYKAISIWLLMRLKRPRCA